VTLDQIEDERRGGMSEAKIRQEFYCSFEAESDDQLIPYDLVSAAQRRKIEPQPFDERVMGVDVARFGDDKSVIYFRAGRDGDPMPYERYSGKDTMELAAIVADWIGRWRPHRVFIDETGVGGGVVDRLRQLGFGQICQGINFGGKADSHRTKENAADKRTEMWLTAREWIATGRLPNDELLAAELTGPMYKYNSNNAIVLEKKDDMKKRGIPSPDVADAFALTFAYPVYGAGFEDDDWNDDADYGRNEATGY
jgi:phage terminase large subunit